MKGGSCPEGDVGRVRGGGVRVKREQGLEAPTFPTAQPHLHALHVQVLQRERIGAVDHLPALLRAHNERTGGRIEAYNFSLLPNILAVFVHPHFRPVSVSLRSHFYKC
eukprot:1159492-Pelagomonas_calceolata.AAC.2